MDDETTGIVPGDDEELTRVTPPDDEATRKMPLPESEATQIMPGAEAEATRVMPGSEAEATRVMPGSEAEATRVMPAAGGGASPPPPAQPTLVMSRRRQPSDGGAPWWVWLIVVLVVLAAGAAVWFFSLRPSGPSTSAGDVFVGNWAPQDGSGGGLVIKKSGDQFTVTEYDPQLQQGGSANATLNGDQLEVTVSASAVGLTDVTGTVQGVLTHDSANDTLTLQFKSGALSLKPIVYDRVDVLLPASPSPTPTPTVTASPTPITSPSPTTTSSPTPSTPPSPGADQQTQDNIAKLQAGIVAWAVDHNNLYPSPQDVVEGGGVAQYVDPWPTNPFDGRPMAPGTSPGSYVYEQLSGGQSYKLTGYLSNGLTYSVP
jgi:hypothetical protein